MGAALLGRSGQVYTGCNVENAAYPLTTCAERTAVVKAVSEGEREFEAIAVVTATGATPCGACRQILREFSPGGDLRVIVADLEGNVHSLHHRRAAAGGVHARSIGLKRGAWCVIGNTHHAPRPHGSGSNLITRWPFGIRHIDVARVVDVDAGGQGEGVGVVP